MNYTIIWDIVAIDSYIAEPEFILKKWNRKEVERFDLLVEKNLDRIALNPTIGIFNEFLGAYSIVISKQTTLYYSFNEKTKIIELYLFWNNLKNPNDLIKLL